MSYLGYIHMSLKDSLLSVSLFCHLASIILCALILSKTLALYKSFTYLLTYLLTTDYASDNSIDSNSLFSAMAGHLVSTEWNLGYETNTTIHPSQPHTQIQTELESSHSPQTSAKAMLFRHSLSDEIKQADVLSAIQTIVAFSTLT